MTLPEYDRVLFGKAPLKLVLAQVRFPILPRFADGSFIAPFQEALRSEYPRVSKAQQVTFQVTSQGIQPGTAGGTLWRLATRGEEWTVVLAETAVTLEVRGYSSINDLLARFERILATAQETLGLSDRTRIGLRYMNELRHPNAKSLADWARLLKPELVGFAATELVEGQVEQMLQEMQWQREDGTLAVRHGFIAEPMEELSATTPGRHFYLIDLDYYNASEEDLIPSSVVSQMRAYNDVQYRFFRWALAEPLYEYLEPRHAS